MSENLIPEMIQKLSFLIPIGAIGAWRWGVWLMQWIAGMGYAPVEPDSKKDPRSLSIVVPVYNEDPVLFRDALDSWSRNRPSEIIAVIDQSDTACIEEFRNFQQEHANAKMVITDVPGKRPALVLGIRAAVGEIVALVDSDTIWGPEIWENLLAPFSDPVVGGVVPRQAALKPQTLAERMFSARLNLRYFHEFPFLDRVGNALTCLSGRTAVYRRDALMPLLDELLNEKFLGKRCISGEDKRLTSLLQGRGWKTKFQQNAVVYSPGAAAMGTFLKQNLRWGRNSWRTDIRVVFSRWAWRKEPVFAYHLIDRAVQPFTLLLGPIYLGIALFYHEWLAAGVLVAWWTVSRCVKFYPHFKHYPKDIVILPFFILTQYVLAVIKIYALLTLDFQSWITRWDKSRLRKFNFLQMLPSQAATLCIIIGMSFLATQHSSALRAPKHASAPQKSQVAWVEEFSQVAFDEQIEGIEKTRVEANAVVYENRRPETPLSIASRFGINSGNLRQIFPLVPPTGLLPAGSKTTIPIAYLRGPIEANPENLGAPLLVTYDAIGNTIYLKGSGSRASLSLIRDRLGNKGLLSQPVPGEWILRANLHVGDGVTLVLDGAEVQWLKLQSQPEKFVYIRSYDGRISIQNSKITSWNEQSQGPDSDFEDGRAYIVAQGSGRMDIENSEIAFLGYSRTAKLPDNAPNPGGIYGLSWKIANGSFGRNVLTGSLAGSSIHDNYFGVYAYGASGLIIRSNYVFNNIQYGIDPHDDSNNLVIENNKVYNNGNHGIIGSKRVVHSVIRNNETVGNRLHGIMLDRQSNYNLVEGNVSRDNVNGLAIYDSHSNIIRNNDFQDNALGIRANNGSSRNIIQGNRIAGSQKGIFFYGGSANNLVFDNSLKSNSVAIALRDSNSNVVAGNLTVGENTLGYRLDDNSKQTNFLEKERPEPGKKLRTILMEKIANAYGQ